MLKKFIAASLLATTLLPASGAFAAQDTDIIPSSTPAAAVVQQLPNSDVSIMALSSYYKVNDYS
ncbi:hypothetical protein, partial [Paenibacillus sp. MAEPY2]|uniref:hypothetical protein n=2 Tax=unclassified Paenibacillus TaxID=185978 RepID=UPI00052D357A